MDIIAPQPDPMFASEFGRFDVKLCNEGSKALAQLPCISYGEYDRCGKYNTV